MRVSGGAADSWPIGMPVVMIAAYVSVRLEARGAQRVRWLALLKFIPYFLFESVRGGIDVARRTYGRL